MRIRAALPTRHRSTWNRWIKLSGGAAAAAALFAGAFPLWAGPADALVLARPAVTLAGSIGTLPAASATVVVDVNMPLDRTPTGDPQRIEEIPVASATVTSPTFSIPVPTSATLQQAEQQGHGIVNLTVMAISGSSMTAEGIPAPIDASRTAATAAQLSTQATGIVQMPAFPAFHSMSTAQKAAMTTSQSPAVPIPCVWEAYGSQNNQLTRIGEAHVANTNGLSDTFQFRYQDDQTITFGFSANAGENGGWTVGGTMSLTSSLSATGHYTFGKGAFIYVDSTYFYQRYAGSAGCPAKYQVLPVGTDANVGPGTNHPGVNPYGGCRNDPYSFAFYGGEGWDKDSGTAVSYSGIATAFGFTFGGSDGYSYDVEHDYESASGSATTYICGSPGYQAVNSPILYNTT